MQFADIKRAFPNITEKQRLDYGRSVKASDVLESDFPSLFTNTFDLKKTKLRERMLQIFGLVDEMRGKEPYAINMSDIWLITHSFKFSMDLDKSEEAIFVDLMLSFLLEDSYFYLLNSEDETKENVDELGKDFYFVFGKREEKDFLKNVLEANKGSDEEKFLNALNVFASESEYQGRFILLNSFFERLKKYNPFGHISEIKPEDIGDFWETWELATNLCLWDKYKKVYRITKELEEDLMSSEEIVFPKSALYHIPFKVFYIDMEHNKIAHYDPKYKGALIRIVEHNGKFLIYATVFLINSIEKVYFIQTLSISIIEDEYLCNKETLKKKYSKENYELPLGTLKLFRETEYFLLSSIFYLCCINKRSNSTKYEKVVSSEGILSQPPDIETLGFTINDLRLKSGLNEKEFTSAMEDAKKEIKLCEVGKGGRKLPKAHLVRGHFQSFWRGKRKSKNRERFSKYIEPYFTGNKKYADTVNITNLLSEK